MVSRVAFITGASSGIGFAAALAFARAGVQVAATARRTERLTELERAAADLPGDILPLAVDVRDGAAVAAAVAAAVERFGRIDYLIANAGVGQRGAVVSADWADLETVLRTNIDGVYHSVRAAVPVMRQNADGGHIVMISSIVFNMTMPYAATYAASKAAVSSLAQSLRLELSADNITVTDMLVGRTQTEFNDKRLGQSGRSSSGIVGSMNVETVANAVVRATQHRPKRMILRPLDRLIVLANQLVPGVIGRFAMRQYRVK